MTHIFSYEFSKSDRIVSISGNNTIHYSIANNKIYLLFLKNNDHHKSVEELLKVSRNIHLWTILLVN